MIEINRKGLIGLTAMALTMGLIAADPAAAAQAVPYKGTNKADKIDFRGAGQSYDIKALGGNDTVFGGYGKDFIDGGAGRDTIDPWDGDDVVKGGAGSDYFRYEITFDGLSGFSGSDTICDFGSGDKLDVYVSFLDGNGNRKSVSGGNFAIFDTNKDGIINTSDLWAKVKKVKTCGRSKDALVLDVEGAYADEDDAGSSGPAFITIVDVTSLKKSQFVNDYKLDHPY